MCKHYDPKKRKFRFYLRHRWERMPSDSKFRRLRVCMRCGQVKNG